MVKKIIKILLILLGVGLVSFLIYHNYYSFQETTERVKQIFNLTELKNFFEIYNENSTVIYEESINEVIDNIESVVESIEQAVDKPFKEVVLDLLSSVLDFGFNFIIYFCNYGLNALLVAYLMLYDNINGTQLEIKTTPFAGAYLMVSKAMNKAKTIILKAIKFVLNYLYKQRRKIALGILIFFASNGVLYRFIVEVVIFLIVYVIRVINLETYLVVFQILRALFTFVYPKLKYIPPFIWIPVIIILVFVSAVSRANYRLKKNHERLKTFAKDELTQTTFINGPPGTGKTLLNVSLSLASEENYVEELEKNLLDYEMKYKYLNFAKVRETPEEFPEHKEYIDAYNFLYNRGTFIISNFAIYSPLFKEYSKIFNFDYMRCNIPTDVYPLEKYLVISFSEMDKEYGSYMDKRLITDEGPTVFFSVTSHHLERKVKIFADYQLKDQVPLRIRGNSEWFLNVKKRSQKYPLILMLYYLPFRLLNKITRTLIRRYESNKKTVTKKSFRKGVSQYKRNDLTLPYIILRDLGNRLQKICDWFDSFYYFKLSIVIAQEEDTKGSKKNLFINIRDLKYKEQKLYDSTFLSYSYKEKKNKDFKDLDRFTQLAPPKEELAKCKSRFYDGLNQ